MAVGRVIINAQINAQIAAPLLWNIHIGCPKKCTHRIVDQAINSN
jgi:hypothetical protein